MKKRTPAFLVAGVDEAGRGPLAGPVVVAAVILDPHRPIDGLDDSKKLSEKQRAVVERRFGLHGYRRETLEQIGEEIGVTRERVRQIQLDALKNLRAMMESHGISGDNMLD